MPKWQKKNQGGDNLQLETIEQVSGHPTSAWNWIRKIHNHPYKCTKERIGSVRGSSFSNICVKLTIEFVQKLKVHSSTNKIKVVHRRNNLLNISQKIPTKFLKCVCGAASLVTVKCTGICLRLGRFGGQIEHEQQVSGWLLDGWTLSVLASLRIVFASFCLKYVRAS
jgi:hypothetical protein